MANIDKRFTESNLYSYINLLRAACDEIASCEFGDKTRARLLLKRYATLVLNKADNTQIDVQVHILTSYLRLEPKLISLLKSDFPVERGLSANLWLGVWNKVETMIDKGWSLNDPENEVRPFSPPPEIFFMSGMNPDDVNDPTVRAEYEKHLKKNKATSEKNKLQVKLRKIKTEYSQQVEGYIVNIYSTPPLNDQELREKLTHFKDGGMKTRILTALSKREAM